MLTLLQHTSSDYPPRTEENVKMSDITFAIAVDFNSAGEKLTKKLTVKHNKKYIPINPLKTIDSQLKFIIDEVNSVDGGIFNEICINIAGNGIYTLKNLMNQNQCDEYTYKLLKSILEHKKLKLSINALRSGGQTGFDEAGIKAGLKLNIPCTVLLPKGYRIRNISGKDIFMSYDDALLRFK